MAQTKLVKVDDDVYEKIKAIAEVRKMNPGSIISLMFTYPCNVCKKPLVLSDDDFEIALKGKNDVLGKAGWGHVECHKKK